MDSPASHGRNGLQDGTLIVGLGSPILRDDAVGLHVARALGARLPKDRFRVIEAGASGLRLLPLLEGWKRVILIDALCYSPDIAPRPSIGRLIQLPLDRLASTLTLNSSHEPSLADTLAIARQIGMAVPQEVAVFGIEVADPFTFDEQMTPALAEKVESLANEIARRCCSI